MKKIALLVSALAFSPLAAHAQAGGASYGEHCAACHGEKGQGNGANIPALTTPSVQQKSDQALFDFITKGNVSNGMPSWAQLPEAERHALVGFVRALSAGASAAVTSSGAAVPLTAPPPPPPFTDFRYEAPGTVRKVTVADLPAPFATDSAGNPPKIVPRPEGAWPRTLPGFTVGLFAEGLEKPRLARTAPNGDVFVAETAAGRIKVFRGMTTEGKAEQSALFIEGLEKPFGIAFYPAGNDPQWIYVADYDRVIRIPYRNGDLKARGAIEKLADIPGGTGHTTRDIQFAKDGKHFYVSVGSKSNIDDPDTTPDETERADILQFDVDGGGRKIFAYGIRNAVGLAVDPKSGELWCSVNERDGLGDNLVPDYITHVEPGGFYGWPWWYMGRHQDPRHMGKHPELKDKVITPDVVLQPHNASLELTFYDGSQFPAEYQGDIFAAEHGSWNKAVRVGYEVIRVPRHHTARASGEYEDFLTGFVVDNEHVWGRPVGITVAQDGSLLVTDDASGSIWRISYTGK